MWNNSLFLPFSEHCVGFSTTGLSVCEDGSIIAINKTIYDFLATFLIDGFLGCVWLKYFIVGEVGIFIINDSGIVGDIKLFDDTKISFFHEFAIGDRFKSDIGFDVSFG